MIERIVKETEWLERLGELPLWNPPTGSTLIVAPHPDDETLGAGGLIASCRARGVDVVVAAVTDGERAYPKTPGLAARRRGEQIEALLCLGVRDECIIRFGFPDSDVAANEQGLVDRLTELVSEDTHLIAPWKGDFHPDHQACGRAAERVAGEVGAMLTSYFFWTWHLGTLASLKNLRLFRFPLPRGLMLAKTEALSCHRAQLFRETGDPILPESLLPPARRPFEVFAAT